MNDDEKKLNDLIIENVTHDPIAQLYASISTETINIEEEEFKDIMIDELRHSSKLMLPVDNSPDLFTIFNEAKERSIDPTLVLTWQEITKLRQDMADNMSVFNNLLNTQAIPQVQHIKLDEIGFDDYSDNSAEYMDVYTPE